MPRFEKYPPNNAFAKGTADSFSSPLGAPGRKWNQTPHAHPPNTGCPLPPSLLHSASPLRPSPPAATSLVSTLILPSWTSSWQDILALITAYSIIESPTCLLLDEALQVKYCSLPAVLLRRVGG